MRIRTLLTTAAACAAIGTGTAHAQDGGTFNPDALVLATDQELEALIVADQVGTGAAHTMGWFYYDELISQGYVDIRDAANPNDDVLKDVNTNGVPDFHEDLYNLNPARPYIGVGPRCPNRLFTHPTPSGQVAQLREPDLLTGDCAQASSYSPTGGPRRWTYGTGYPTRPGGGVVGARTTYVLDIASDGPGYLKTDSWFSDRGLFPHIPNLLEPRHPLNGNRGLGHLALLATDDDENRCGDTSAYGPECLQPRMAWSADGGTQVQVGPVWDRGGYNDGLPDYKASAFDNQGRLIPGRSPTAAITEADRKVRIGRVQGGREIVFFLVAYIEQIYDGTDSCFMASTATGRLQCTLWAHGDINVFFSKTALNLDVYQPLNTLVATKTLATDWLPSVAYSRLATPTYGNVVFSASQSQSIVAHGQRTPHTLVAAPTGNSNVWVLGWEDINSGGNRSYDDITVLINKLPPSATP